jgi:hypothetical protein
VKLAAQPIVVDTYQFMPRPETHPQAGLFHSASVQFGNTHAATIVCGRVVSTVIATAAKVVSNVATNKALMALAPRPNAPSISRPSSTLVGQTLRFPWNLGGRVLLAISNVWAGAALEGEPPGVTQPGGCPRRL